MKNSAKNKIKTLLLSAAAALLPTHAQAEEATTFMPDLGNNDYFFGETNQMCIRDSIKGALLKGK